VLKTPVLFVLKYLLSVKNERIAGSTSQDLANGIQAFFLQKKNRDYQLPLIIPTKCHNI